MTGDFDPCVRRRHEAATDEVKDYSDKVHFRDGVKWALLGESMVKP